MRKVFLKWVYTPARWYQFWMPMSGIYGGLIIISLCVLAEALVMAFLK